MTDMYVDDPCVTVILEIPYTVQQLVPAGHFTPVIREVKEQFKFLRRQDELPVLEINIITVQVDFKVTDFEDLLRLFGIFGLGAPEDGFHPGHDFARAERFRQIIIRTELEPEYLIEFIVLCRQHENWQVHLLLTQCLTYIYTVHSRQHEVQNHQIRLFIQGCLEPGWTVFCSE